MGADATATDRSQLRQLLDKKVISYTILQHIPCARVRAKGEGAMHTIATVLGDAAMLLAVVFVSMLAVGFIRKHFG